MTDAPKTLADVMRGIKTTANSCVMGEATKWLARANQSNLEELEPIAEQLLALPRTKVFLGFGPKRVMTVVDADELDAILGQGE